jgi:leukotriene-A4 hydrolase
MEHHDACVLTPQLLTPAHCLQAFSSVPYEKGSQFLYFLELTVGGAALFEPFLKAYVNRVRDASGV